MKLNVKDKLATKNMSRYELAKRIGVTYPTITAIFNGDSTSIKLDILEALCRELDCTPNEILVTDDKDVELNIESEKLSSQLVPVMIEMLKSKPTSETDLIHYISIDKKEEFQENLNKYMNLLCQKKEDDI